MTNLPANRPVVKSPAARSAAMLSRFVRLDEDIRAYLQVYQEYSAPGASNRLISDAQRSKIKSAIRAREGLLAQWQEWNRRSSDEEIATQLVLLQGVITSPGTDDGLFPELLFADVTAYKPTRYALVRACSTVRQRDKFLSIGVLVDEIKKAKAHGAAIDRQLRSDDLAKRLAWIEEAQPRLLAERRQYNAQQAERRRRYVEGTGIAADDPDVLRAFPDRK
jgi:hypothetical protein